MEQQRQRGRSWTTAGLLVWLSLGFTGCELTTEVFTDKEIRRIETRLTEEYKHLKPPKLLNEAQHAVLKRLVYKGVEIGSCRFLLTLTSEGDVYEVEVVKSTGAYSADKSVVAGMKKWKFQPAAHAGGGPAECQVTVTAYVELKTREL